MSAMKTKTLTLDAKILEQLQKLRDELDSIIETIEIVNDPELVEEIRKAREEVRKGETEPIEKLIEEAERKTKKH